MRVWMIFKRFQEVRAGYPGSSLARARRVSIVILITLGIIQYLTVKSSFCAKIPFENLKPISIEFREVDLPDVLRILSAKAGVNIVVSPDVKGKVTARFEKPTSLSEILNFILETHGCRYEVVDNVIKVSKVKVPLLVRSFS
ncbi:hypothetical protein DRJ00_01105, partial [Candidatus Aerophobetes bacterium]